ncbi:MAG: oligopeptide/dipeptide ABC transporter ATP-binding protein [bacterium]
MAENVLLSVRDIKVYFPITSGILVNKTVGYIRAVNGVSFDLAKGETLGLVGESGCGKSTTAKAILQLNRPTSGDIFFEGKNLAKLEGESLRLIYRKLQVIYQDPYASLNPRMTVGQIIAEPIECFGLMRGREMRVRVGELLETVGLDERFINRYPHEFSGGQRQRIGIARALAVNPAIVICDEPVSALDVSIRAQIINLLDDLQNQFGFSYLFIAHDLSVVKHISDRVAVMYLGKIVELAPSAGIYDHALHPYTLALLSAVPIPDPEVEAKRRRIILTGDVPSPDTANPGCDFAKRCSKRVDRCDVEIPELREISPGHFAACHLC